MLLKWFLTVLLIIGWLHMIYSIAELPWIIGKALEKVVWVKEEEPVYEPVYDKSSVCVTKQKGYETVTTCYKVMQDAMSAVEHGDTVVFRAGTYVSQDDKVSLRSNVFHNNVFHDIAPAESEGWPNSTDCPWDTEKQVNVCN